MINYNNKVFRSLGNSVNGEVDDQTIFHYKQKGSVVEAYYAGGNVLQGSLIAIVDALGHLDMRYHHVNTKGELMTGICHSVPERLPDGRIRLYETWQWTSGDGSAGKSIIEEVRASST